MAEGQRFEEERYAYDDPIRDYKVEGVLEGPERPPTDGELAYLDYLDALSCYVTIDEPDWDDEPNGGWEG